MFSPTPAEAEVLGRTLRAMRNGVGLSGREVARRLNLSANTISQFERGKRIVSAETLAQIARVVADEIATQRGDAA